MTITKEFFLLRGVTVQLLCFADNSIGRSTSKFFVKGGMYFRLNSEIYEMTVFEPLFTIFFLDMELTKGMPRGQKTTRADTLEKSPFVGCWGFSLVI